MPKCDYCGHPVYPPDESGNNDHVICIVQTMIDEHWNPSE
jgi:formylmethanofuran dehydrogenase subunit E